MNWKKGGLIFNVNGEFPWNKSYAQCPVVDLISNDVWRIYYSTRNDFGKSQISYIEVEAGNPKNILYVHNDYLFDFGKPGTFDDSGLMPSSIVTIGEKKYLYYIGWTTKVTVAYENSIGIAVSNDGGESFEKLFQGSIMPPLPNEPYFTGTSFVLKEDDLWRMYYLSCTGWHKRALELEPRYHIKYAESSDGINWIRESNVAIDYKSKEEGGIVSASVIKLNYGYQMWYAYRLTFDYRKNKKNSYRIGFATSKNGIDWVRNDSQLNLDVSENGWDSEMVSYPNVIEYKGNKYMFYNGNSFGKTGFGYAIL
jgi:hypothetical protein